jgi:3-mercaptopyruvate sulfurtransferase SseA
MFFVYGTSHDDTIAKAASKRLMELGFDDVYTLKGGLESWKSAGKDVVTDPSANPAEKPAKGVPAAKPS